MLFEHKPIALGSSNFIEQDVLEGLKQVAAGSVSLVVSSPPYNIRKDYERDSRLDLKAYLAWQREILFALSEKVDERGSICWQIGNYVQAGEVFPLDLFAYEALKDLGFKLRNRIVWRFNFGLNADARFSGRYETILWATKSDSYRFNLDSVRVPQLYPGKRHGPKKGDKAGKPSGNPLGKNPSDYWEFSAERDFRDNPVWEIPNVKARHPEYTPHPCQFPIELAERCVLALTEEGDSVLDPFVGSGATVLAAIKHGRNGIGVDREPAYLKLAQERVQALAQGELPMRPLGRPIQRPSQRQKVAQVPAEWTQLEGYGGGEAGGETSKEGQEAFSFDPGGEAEAA